MVDSNEMLQARAAALRDEADGYRQRLTRAERDGDQDAVTQLQARLEQVEASITATTSHAPTEPAPAGAPEPDAHGEPEPAEAGEARTRGVQRRPRTAAQKRGKGKDAE